MAVKKKAKTTKKVTDSDEKKVTKKKVVAKKASVKKTKVVKKSAKKTDSDSVSDKKAAESKTIAARPVKATALQIRNMDKLSKLIKKWHMLQKQHKDVVAKKYVITGTFEEKTPIIHQNMGWGYIMAEKNDRLEVLFESGVKMLISNYKR